MGDVIKQKSFPESYSSDALDILDAMAFDGGKGVMLLGSQSIRSQQYAGDYDAYQVVKKKGSVESVLKSLTAEFSQIIKNLRGTSNLVIGDIKSGEKSEWRILPKDSTKYNAEESKTKVDVLLRAEIITKAEATEALSMLKPKLGAAEFLIAKKELRYNVIRWTPEEVIRGHKTLRDGSTYTLEEAFSSPIITKLDVIGFIQNNKYTEFSMLYEFEANGKVLNPDYVNISKSLEDDILYYAAEHNSFKVLKRLFALAKFKNDTKTLERLTPILNSDLGRLYSISSDINVLITLLESGTTKVDMKNIRFEIDQFKSRMSNVYSVKSFLASEHTLIGHLNTALKTTSKTQMATHLKAVQKIVEDVLEHATSKIVDKEL